MDANFVDAWGEFSEKLGLSEQAKLESVQFVFDTENTVQSVEFKIIDQKDNEFHYYWYKQCFYCENKIIQSHDIHKEWIQYKHLVRATNFFSALDQIPIHEFIHELGEHSNFVITSTGLNEIVAEKGRYMKLENNTLKGIQDESYQGYYIKFSGEKNDSKEHVNYFVFF